MSTLSETVLVFVGLFGGAILGLGIGIIYFVKTQRDARLWVRALASSFGPSLALIFAVASLWWPEQYRYQPKGVHAFYWLQVVPMLLLTFTLARYPGPRRLHWILLPAGLLAWLWTFVLGWLFVHGE